LSSTCSLFLSLSLSFVLTAVGSQTTFEGISCTRGAVVAAALFLEARGSVPCQTPSLTPRSSSVLVSWHSAHGEHHSHAQKSETADPRIENLSRICTRRQAPSPIAATPATAEMIVSTCHEVLYWATQTSTLRANVSASAAPAVAASAREARQRSFWT